MADPIRSPTIPQSPSHPLPPRPAVITPSDALASPSSRTSTPTQQVSKFRGGFEVDDDGEDQAVDALDDDVYAPVTSGVVSLADHNSLDRTPQTPTKANGTTAAPTQTFDSPADVPSSAVPNLPAQDPAPLPQITSSLSAQPKSRLSHDVIGILEDRVKDDPRGDIDAWLELIQEYKNRNKEDETRKTYERYLAVFPLAADQWAAWLRWEEQHDRKVWMERILSRCLTTVPDVNLINIYINYVRRRNNMQTGDKSKAYAIIHSAFNSIALKYVGMDKDAGLIWQDYINFLKSGPGTVGGTTWEDNQKMDTLRDAYKRALSLPTGALQALWKEYDAFETGISKINGRKYMQERSPDYMTARGAYTQLQNITRDLQRTSRPKLPPAVGFDGDVEYQQQVAIWKQWIEWEKEDPLILKEDETNREAYADRVIFTYKQALMALQFWPEMWYEAADFCFSQSRDEEGLELLTQGAKCNPESPLLAFRLADRLEATGAAEDTNDVGSKARMQKVREPYDRVLDALYELHKKTEARLQTEIQRLETAAQEDQTNGEEVNASNIGARKAALDAQIDGVKESNRAHTDMLGRIISHVWTALMRATRRIQGKGLPNEKIGGFRAVFSDARKRGKLMPDFYVDAAHIEWICYRDAAGTKIFERGAKLYPDDPVLPLEYIKHLLSKDDLTNARAVFETTVNRFTTNNDPLSITKAKPLFAFFHDYESKYGELAQVIKLELRMRELYPEDPSLRQFSLRFRTPTFDPLAVQPIISLKQIVPKLAAAVSLDTVQAVNSPVQKVIDQIVSVNSPKRPRPLDDDDEERPSKLQRGNSPMFPGVEIKKVPLPGNLPAVTRPQPAAPSPLPPQISYLLSILPKSSTYDANPFKADEIHKLIRDVHLPPPGTAVPPRTNQPTQQQGQPAGWPPQYAQQHHPVPIVAPPQSYMPPQAQYGQNPQYIQGGHWA